MPLLQFPFRGGIDEQVDPKQAQPGTLLVLENARQVKTGLAEKRAGLNYRTNSAYRQSAPGVDFLLSQGRKVISYKDELLVINDSTLYSFSSAANRWVERDVVSEVVGTREGVQQFSGRFTDPDVAYAGGLEFYTWRSGDAITLGDIFVTVRDEVTGVGVVTNLQLTTGATFFCPKLVVSGGWVTLIYGDTATTRIYSRSWQVGVSRSWSTQNTLITDPEVRSSAMFYDVCACPNGNFLVSYSRSNAGISLCNARFTPGAPPSVGISWTEATTAITLILAVANTCTSNGTIWVTWTNTTDVRMWASNYLTAANLRIASMQTVTNLCNRLGMCNDPADATAAYVTMGFLGANTDAERCRRIDTGSVNASMGLVQTGFLVSRPFVKGGRVYALFMGFESYMLVCFDQGATSAARPVCTLAARIAYGTRYADDAVNIVRYSMLNVALSGDGVTYFTGGTVIADANAKARLGLSKFRFHFDDCWLAKGSRVPIQRWQPAEYGDSLYLSGGLPSHYDGVRVAEAAYLEPPTPLLTPFNSAGSMLPGVYTYRCYWEVTDARGQVHRSAPGLPRSVTTIGAGNVNRVVLTLNPLGLTSRQTALMPDPKVALVVCRSTKDGTADVLYRQTSTNVPTANQNDPTVFSFTITDTQTDTLTFPLIYTTGGYIENMCPPSLLGLIKHRRRLAGIGDDLRTVWLSTEYVDREAPGWNEVLTIQFDEDLVALASLDDKLVAFSRTSIWVVYGDGPNALGFQSDWSSPQRIQADVGCVCPHSVVGYPDGVAFQSAKGIYLISRALQVQPLGRAVDNTLETFPVITAANVIEGRDLVVWECQNVGGTAGRALVWDYLNRIWSIDRRNPFGSADVPMRSATVHQSVYQCITSANYFLYEDSTTNLDAGEWVTMAAETTWISPEGPHSFQRVRKVQLLGEHVTAHGLRISAQVDHKTGWDQGYTWTDTQNDTLRSKVEMRLGARLARCTAVRLRFEDVKPTVIAAGIGAGSAWSGVCLDVVPREGARRFGAGAKA